MRAKLLSLFTYRLTVSISKVVIPAACKCERNGVCDTRLLIEKSALALNGSRSVIVNCCRNAESLKSESLVSAFANHINHFINRELIKELVPERIISGNVGEHYCAVLINNTCVLNNTLCCGRRSCIAILNSLSCKEMCRS